MKNTFKSAVRTPLFAYLAMWFLLPCAAAQSQSNSVDSIVVFGLAERAMHDLRSGRNLELAVRLDSLEAQQKALDRDDWKVSILCALTEIHIMRGQLTLAESFSQSGLDLLHSTSTELPDTLVDLVYYLHAAGQFEQRKLEEFSTYIDSSWQILKSLPEPDLVREARNAIRMSYLTYYQGNVNKTIEWTKMGIASMVDLDHLTKSDSTQLASLYNNIAFLNDASGRFDEVIPNYNYALQYDPKLVSAYNNQANKLRSTQPTQSIDLSQKALVHIAKSDYFNRCNAYNNIVSSYLVLAEQLEDSSLYHKALQYNDSIVQMSIFARPQDYPFAANSHGIFADYFSRVGKKRDLEQAWFHLEQNLELAQKAFSYENMRGVRSVMLPAKERLARLSIMRQDFSTADKSLKEVNFGYHPDESKIDPDRFSINSSFLLDNSSTLAYPLTYLSMMLSWSENQEDPMAKLGEADYVFRVVDSTYDRLLRKNELEIEQLRFDRLYTRGAGISIKSFEATQDFTYLEEAHARIEKLFTLDLFQNLVQARLKNSTDKESAIYREKLILREEIDLLTRQVSDDPTVQTKLDSLNTAYIAVLDKLGTGYQENSTTSVAQFSLEKLKQQLAIDEAMVYFVHDKMGEALYGLCVTENEVVPIQQPVADLEALIYQTNRSLADPNSTAYSEQLRNLYNVFIEPIEQVIAGKSLIISSIGELELVPYDLLLDSEDNYLCFEHSIRHVYSAGLQERDTEQGSNGDIYGYTSSPKNAVAAVMRGGEEFTNLKAAREEIDFLKSEFNARVFVDKKSTKQVFENTANDAAVLHLAMHGVVNPLEPLKSRIVFDLEGNQSEDLYYHEIDDLDIGARLITLSACNSGKGVVRGAGSMASLARAFNYAGCPNVVQTLWSINDESSLDLMKSFYHELSEGRSVPQALANAKYQFYSSVPAKWKHPYYWGGFVYNGQDTQINLSSSTFPGYFRYGLALGLLALLVILFMRRRHLQKL